MEALHFQKHYTYSDYLNWDTNERHELIDGIPHLMSPAPMWKHQGISRELSRQLSNFLYGKPCLVFAAPFDVRLNADAGDDTVVQPDIVVVCDRSKLCETGYAGVPDMAIEILSPSSDRHDRFVKFNLYLRAGVREYWVVDPESKTVTIHVLDNSKYVTTVYGETDSPPVHVLDGCSIALTDVFAD